MGPSPLQNLIDIAEETAGLISDHIKAKSGELPEEALIPWSLAFSQLQEATQQLRTAVQLDCSSRMLAVGGPLHGQSLPASDTFVTPAAEDCRKVHTYKRVHLRFSSGFRADVAAYMG